MAIITWIWFSGSDAPPPPPDNSVHQTHSGGGDNVGRDKNVSNDNSIHQTNSGGGDNVAGNKIVNQLLPKSAEYKRLEQELKDAEELLAGIAEDKIELRLKQAAKVKELRK
ncbi:MAG: hypothetical protein D3904_08370 [Candidatus Electrothrix sp. EH2]|nr:hypothetical protein [Candidatus Electrothrix sp. EH2]